jgi:hypothetical protein
MNTKSKKSCNKLSKQKEAGNDEKVNKSKIKPFIKEEMVEDTPV